MGIMRIAAKRLLSPGLALVLALMFTAIALVGCSQEADDRPNGSGAGGEKSAEAGGKPEATDEKQVNPGSAGSAGKQDSKVTLTFWGRHMSKSQFESEVKGPLEKKFPDLTLNYMSSPASATPPGIDDPLVKAILAGEGPDIVLGPHPSTIRSYKETGILADLTPYIRQEAMDLGLFENAFVEGIRAYGGGDLLALPYKRHWFALFHNLDLFDRFGVAYPKDGMSWDEILDLSKKLTVRDGERQYYGLQTPGHGDPMAQLGLTYVDAASGKAAVSGPSWSRFLSVMHAIPQIKYTIRPNEDDFVRLQLAAMSAGTVDRHKELVNSTNPPFRWNVATYPIFPEIGEVVPGSLENYAGVSARSQHKEDAFRVIRHMVSREFQLDNSRKGTGSVLREEAVHREFATASDAWKGKNVAALFKYRPQSSGIPGALDDKVSQAGVGQMLMEMIQNREEPKAAAEKLEREINRILAQ
jgi:multiple sugar transport system substrate-binding protein